MALIRSVQRGQEICAAANTSEAITITEVDIAHSRLLWSGNKSISSGNANTRALKIEFTDSTTITATRAGQAGDPNEWSHEVIEEYP